MGVSDYCEKAIKPDIRQFSGFFPIKTIKMRNRENSIDLLSTYDSPILYRSLFQKQSHEEGGWKGEIWLPEGILRFKTDNLYILPQLRLSLCQKDH